jgi:hypothetical protein
MAWTGQAKLQSAVSPQMMCEYCQFVAAITHSYNRSLIIWLISFRYKGVRRWGDKNLDAGIQNSPDWCRYLYSSCGSGKRRSQ